MAGKRNATRAEDEVVLRVLHLTCIHGPARAGQITGVSGSYCSVLRQRIMAADVAESGEDPAVVRPAYHTVGAVA